MLINYQLALMSFLLGSAGCQVTGALVSTRLDSVRQEQSIRGWVVDVLEGAEGTFAASVKEPGKALYVTSCAVKKKSAYGLRLRCEQRPRSFEVVMDHKGKKGAVILAAQSRGAHTTLTLSCKGVGDKPRLLHCEPETSGQSAREGLVSPFASSIASLGLPNAHVVTRHSDGRPLLLRSMNPQLEKDFSELQDLGVESVLVFKDQTKHEVDHEVLRLIESGVSGDQILRMPFAYKDHSNFESPCRQVVGALRFMSERVKEGKTTLVHCTVGEDRTGLLTGLYRLLSNPRAATVDGVFQSEMCEFGYSGGNPEKPLRSIVLPINSDLTPIYLKMAYFIKQGRLTASHLSEDVCRNDPSKERAYRRSALYDVSRYQCSTSTRYLPSR